MKIKFKQQHISITQFEPIDINDFSILTGKNGSGKTHFLDAIKQGRIEIEGINKSEIVYYNYNDFTVFTGNLQQNPEFLNRLKAWNNEKQVYLNRIHTFNANALQLGVQKRTMPEQIIFNFLQQPNFSFEQYFGNLKDFELLDHCKDSNDILTELNSKQTFFTQHFYQFIHQYLIFARGDINELTYDWLKSKFDDQKNSIEQYLNEEDKDFYNFLKNTIGDKSISAIDTNDFESPNFFLEDIANEEKEYQLKKAQNILNKVNAQEYKENVKYLDADKFIQENGLSPIEQINNVLFEYDCNGYFLYTNPYQPLLGVDKNNIKIQITLKHEEKNYVTNFERLSSGEKTLIALSLFIYKSRKNRIIPRVLLLDEIDSSLHPSMINRLLNVLENVFIKEQGFKVIMATHSPTTVALSPNDSIYIIKKNGEQKISKEIKANAIKILTEGIATVSEEDTSIGINYNINQTELPVLFTEGITDKIILKTGWGKLYDDEMPFFIQDCFDASFLGNLFRRAEDGQDGIFINYPDKVFIALFDFDQEGYNVWNGLKKKYTLIEENPIKGLTLKHPSKNAYAILLPVNENEDIIKQVLKSENETYGNESILPIELLFYGLESLSHYFKKEKIAGGGEVILFKGKKRDFANSLNNLNKDDFKVLLPLFEKLKEITGLKMLTI